MFNRECILGAGQRILLTLWVGGLWISGYLIAPLLFSTLDDRRLAGEIAGRIFSAMNYLGLSCALLLLISLIYDAGQRWQRSWRVWAVVAMFILISIIEFIVQPMMQGLKAATPEGFIAGSAAAARFGLLHGVSSLLYLITSIVGLALVSAGLKHSKP